MSGPHPNLVALAELFERSDGPPLEAFSAGYRDADACWSATITRIDPAREATGRGATLDEAVGAALSGAGLGRGRKGRLQREVAAVFEWLAATAGDRRLEIIVEGERLGAEPFEDGADECGDIWNTVMRLRGPGVELEESGGTFRDLCRVLSRSRPVAKHRR